MEQAFLYLAIVTALTTAGGLGMAFLMLRAYREVVTVLRQSNREMLAAVVAHEVRDPRVNAMAVNHLLHRDILDARDPQPRADESEADVTKGTGVNVSIMPGAM